MTKTIDYGEKVVVQLLRPTTFVHGNENSPDIAGRTIFWRSMSGKDIRYKLYGAWQEIDGVLYTAYVPIPVDRKAMIELLQEIIRDNNLSLKELKSDRNIPE